MASPPPAPAVPAAVLTGISPARLAPYLAASHGRQREAFRLYRWNVLMSGALHESLHVTEVVLRNAMDAQLRLWNATQVDPASGANHSPDWLVDPSRLLVRLLRRALATLRENAAKAVRRSADRARPLTHGDHVAQVGFGTWRFLLPPRNPTSDPGKQRLWDDSLVHAFPHRTRATNHLVDDVDKVHRIRNRVAHLEPVIVPGQPAAHRIAMQRILADIDPAHAAWLGGAQRITSVEKTRPSPGDAAPRP